MREMVEGKKVPWKEARERMIANELASEVAPENFPVVPAKTWC